MTKAVAHKKTGRPLKLPPADAADRIRDFAADGFSVIGVARRMGTSKETLARWMDDYPELRDAFDEGREQERHVLHNVIYRKAVEKDDITAAIMLLNARHGYRTDQSDHGNRVNVTIALPGAMTLQQFTAITEKEKRNG